MMVPTIHMNGSSKGSLVDGICAANHALYTAMQAVRETYPNGRDYYPQGQDALKKATQEHEDRLFKLQAVANELMALVEAIADGGFKNS